MFGDAFARLAAAHVAHSAQHDDGEDDALDTVKPTMADAFGVLGERRESAGCFEEAGEPCQPQQRPAVKALEAKIGNGFGDKAHGREYAPRVNPVELGAGFRPILERGPSGPPLFLKQKECV